MPRLVHTTTWSCHVLHVQQVLIWVGISRIPCSQHRWILVNLVRMAGSRSSPPSPSLRALVCFVCFGFKLPHLKVSTCFFACKTADRTKDHYYTAVDNGHPLRFDCMASIDTWQLLGLFDVLAHWVIDGSRIWKTWANIKSFLKRPFWVLSYSWITEAWLV